MHTTPMTFSEAETFCEGEGQFLASVHSSSEADELAFAASQAGVSIYWIGGQRIGTSGSADATDWMWADGTSFEFTNWADEEPNFWRSKEFCTRVGHPNFAGNGWNDAKCDKQEAFACVAERVVVAPDNSQGSGDVPPVVIEDADNLEADNLATANWWNVGPNLLEYKFFSQAASWNDAEAACEKDGGLLASIRSASSLNDLIDYAAAENIDAFHIGLFSAEGDNDDGHGNWQWVDHHAFPGQLLDHDSDGSLDVWAPNEPNNFKGKEFCVAVANKGFNDLNCKTARRAYVCQYRKTTTTSTVGPTTTTTAGPTTVPPETTSTITTTPTVWVRSNNQVRFEAFATRVSHADAALACDDLGGALAGVGRHGDIDEIMAAGSAIGVTTMWTGAVRNDEGAFEFVDGFSSYWVWAAGEPNNFKKKENCGAITNGGRMNDRMCKQKLAFVCQFDDQSTTTSTGPTTTTTEAPSTTTTVAATTTTTEAPSTTTTVAATTTTTAEPTTTTTAEPTTSAHSANFRYQIFKNRVTSFEQGKDYCFEKGGAVVADLVTTSQYNMLRSMADDVGVTTFYVAAVRKSGANSNTDADFFMTVEPFALFTELELYDADKDGRTELWADNEPNNFKKKEGCVASKPAGLNDVQCTLRGKNNMDGVACRFDVTTTTAAPTTTTTAAPTTSTTAEPTTRGTTTTGEPTTSTTVEPTTTTTAAPTTTTTEEPTTTTTEEPTTTTTLEPTTTTTLEPTSTTLEPTTKKPKFTRPVAAVESKYFYYKFFDQRSTWEEASDFCFEAGGALAIIRDEITNANIWDEAQDRGFGTYWIGGIRKMTGGAYDKSNSDSAFQWGGSNLAFGAGISGGGMWMSKEPNNFKNKENCVRVGKSGRADLGAGWNDANCNEQNPFVCAFDVSTTTSTALPTTSTTAAPTTTTTVAPSTTTVAPPTTTTPPPYDGFPEGWAYFDGCWYGQYGTKMKYVDAVASCGTFAGSTIASPQTEEAATFIYELEGRRGRPRWVSSSEIDSPGYPVRVNGYGGWYPGEPSGGNGDQCIQQGLGSAKADVTPWKFNDASCLNKNRYVCQHCLATTPTTTTTVAPTTTTTLAPTTTTTEPQTTTTTAEPTTITTTTGVPTTTTTGVPTTTTTAEPTTTTEPWQRPSWPYNEDNRCHYKYFDNNLNWDDAMAFCTSAYESGGYQARATSITGMDEAKFIASLDGVRAGKPRWVGVKNFLDIGGDNFNGAGVWHENEPNLSDECVSQGLTKKKKDTEFWRLNDANCGNKFGVVCQWCRPPEPTTTTSTTVVPTTTTTVAPTTTTTVAPSTTTTTVEATTDPCPDRGNNLYSSDASYDQLVRHIQGFGDFAGSYVPRRGGNGK
jgi:hypothetical protein